MDYFFAEYLAFPDTAGGNDTVQSSGTPFTIIPPNPIILPSHPGNMNTRMVECLNQTWGSNFNSSEQSDRHTNRHAVDERWRRQREKDCYVSLHSLLPQGTKRDKISILQSATVMTLEMKQYKEMLERRSTELERKLADVDSGGKRGAYIRFSVSNPASGVDSMLEALRCLNSMGLEPNRIQTDISDQKLAAVIDVKSVVDEMEVKDVVQRILQEVEEKNTFRLW